MNDSELENREIVEDKEKVQQIAVEIMEPALQKHCLKRGRRQVPRKPECISAIVACSLTWS